MCACAKPAVAGMADGMVRVSRETKGRAGRGVTVVKGLALEAAALAELGRQLRATCGTGGTVKGGSIELQGDHRDAVIEALAQQGWKVRRSGG